MNQVSLSHQTATAASEVHQLSVARLGSATQTRPAAERRRELKTVERLIRHRATRQYFKDGGWTADPLGASVVADSLEAVQACVRYGLTNVELSVRIGTGPCDLFSTPLR